MASVTPKFLEFRADMDDWDIYVERLEQHFAANKIEEEKIKIAILLSSIGQDTYKLLKDLSFPLLPKEIKYGELCKMLKDQYQIQPCTWRERRKFYQLRNTDEGISEWYAKVRSMATKCKFDNDLTKILRDKFVTGMKDGKILDRLCEEDESKSLEDLIALAQKQENMASMNYMTSKFPPKTTFRKQTTAQDPNGRSRRQQRRQLPVDNFSHGTRAQSRNGRGSSDEPDGSLRQDKIRGQMTDVNDKKVSPEVLCTPNQMRVEIPLEPNTKSIYLQGLRDYPDPACRPHTDPTGKMAVLELDLDNVYRCAVTRVVNKQTGKKIYYQTIIVENMETENEPKTRETLHVKCSMLSLRDHTITRRNVFPAGFEEPIDLETTTSLIGMAPQPNITVGVRQAGKLVSGELNVSPGTPLQMEISLDSASTSIYGLLVTHMQVSDTKAQEETIIYNGCSVDPYLFDNFNTIDGDNLVAKFRAFKFPESTYVQFKGTVNVCLDRCKGVECSDGVIGYGRKKREISSLPADPNKIFEITITSFIKVNYDDDSENFEQIVKNQTKMYSNKKLIVGNQMTDDVRYFKPVNDEPHLINELREEQKYTSIIAENSASPTTLYAPLLVFLGIFKYLLL